MTIEEEIAKFPVQGQTAVMEDAQVMNPDTMQPVPADSSTIGEIMLRGNVIMKGYLKNPAATEDAFREGWFRTGDLAVLHGNGRFEIKDRSKGAICSSFAVLCCVVLCCVVLFCFFPFKLLLLKCPQLVLVLSFFFFFFFFLQFFNIGSVLVVVVDVQLFMSDHLTQTSSSLAARISHPSQWRRC
jgi:hypothetical protein